MTRLLHVLPSVSPAQGGTTEAVLQICRELQRLGHQSDVVTLDDPHQGFVGQFEFPVIALGPATGSYGYCTKLLPWFAAHARQYDAVIIHGLWTYHSFGTWRALRKTGVPFFTYTHGMLDPWFKIHYPLKHLKKWLYWPWAEYRVLRDSRAVLFTCEEERLLARRSFWLYRARERVVAFGTSAPPADSAALRAAFLAAHPEIRDRRVLLFLGRIHEKKGCDLLIRAFAGLATDHPDLHLVMAGPDPTGLMARLTAMSRDLGLQNRISWPGMLSGNLKWGAFYSADAFVLPSHQENFGIAVAEALGCGVPALISNKVNIWREIEAGGAGLVDDDTQAGTVRLLTRWLAMPAQDRGIMSVCAHELFARSFTPAAMAESLLGVIAEQRSPSRKAKTRRGVFFVAPLPPPLTGFSHVSNAMLAQLQRQAPVKVFDRAKRSPGAPRHLLNQVYKFSKFAWACCRQPNFVMYLALSGGRGQIFDSLYALTVKVFRQAAFVHHHSFAYVDSPTIVNRWAISLLRDHTHIVLSRRMAVALARRYQLDVKRIVTLSNAAFYEDAPKNDRAASCAGAAPLRLGYLSNITFEKGFVEFFRVLSRLRLLEVEFQACVAGPVAPEAQAAFDRLCADAPDVEDRGAVYGEDKDQFYRELDILVFPTKYAHEADPLVIHEALRSAVYVIACNRGAIGDTLDHGAGRVLNETDFINSAAACIRSLASDRLQLLEGQSLAFKQSMLLRRDATEELAKILADIVSSPTT